MTDIISLVRYATGKNNVIEPFSDTVNRRFEEWMSKQENSGRKFTSAQKEWLIMIKNHVATSFTVVIDDFELSPFYEKGGLVKLYQLFGSDFSSILEANNRAFFKFEFDVLV